MRSNRSKQIMISFVLIICLIKNIAGQSDCYPSFTLPNIIKDLVSLQYSNSSEQTYSYLFFSAMFSGPPQVAYSISQLSIEQAFSNLNYYLNVEIVDNNINFHYNSPLMKWAYTAVNFWITSRSDIIISKNILNNLGKSNTNYSFSLNNAPVSIDSKSTHIPYIVGIYSNFTNNITLSVSPVSLGANTATLSVNIGNNMFVTNISIISVIFNPNLGQFLSNSGKVSYKSFSTQYYNLFSNFLPLYYVMVGINGFSLTGTNLLQFSYLCQIVNSTILASSSNTVFDIFSVSYASIGTPMQEICSPCNNYFYQNNCIDTCASGTYPFNFDLGGKACLTCDPLVGQILNSLSNGCNCLPGYQLMSANQCVAMNKTLSKCTGLNLIQNGSSCVCSPGTFNISGVCRVCPSGQNYQNGICINTINPCPANSFFNSITQTCVCNSGFMNVSNTCIPCQQDQYFDTASNTCKCTAMNTVVNNKGMCQCLPNFYNINGFCISCPPGTVYNGNSCVTSACPDNQISINGKCVCDDSSIPLGSICIKCASGTYAQRLSNICVACLANCLVCSNKISCNQCADGYAYNTSSNSCSSISVAIKLVSIREGYPLYTLEVLVTDFIINSTFGSKSNSDIMKMISLKFSDSTTIPQYIYYIQNPNMLNSFRIVFYYQGLIPMGLFNVKFLFYDSTINLSQNITLSYEYTIERLQPKLN